MRLKSTMKNAVWNLIAEIALILTGIFLKRALLSTIGTEKVGLNYVLNDFVNMISIAELGIAGVISYHLYEPLAFGDKQKVIQIIGLFRRAFKIVGIVVILCGLVLMPMLNYIVKDPGIEHTYIYAAYILFLLRNAEGYFFAYKCILPYADQKQHISLIVSLITNFAYSIIAIFVILITKNFLFVLLVEIFFKFVYDFIMIRIINYKYPYVKSIKYVSVTKDELKRILIDIKDRFVSKISRTIVSITDNLSISIFLGLNIAGLFSNYTLVLYSIENILTNIVLSAQASMGNLIQSENDEVIHSVVEKMTFISFYIVSFCGCCLFQLSTPFVAICFGEKYILSQIIVIICVYNIFVEIMEMTMIQLSDAGGLFKEVKRINIITCIMDVVFSVIGALTLGIVGILLATFIARTVEFGLRIILNFKRFFRRNYFTYVIKLIRYIILFTLELGMISLISKYVHINNQYIEFVIYTIIAASIPLIINTIVYHGTDDFQYMKNVGRILIDRKKDG